MDLQSLLKRLVETESPTSDKIAVDRVGAIIADEARRLGADVQLVPVKEAGNHVIARWNEFPSHSGRGPGESKKGPPAIKITGAGST